MIDKLLSDPWAAFWAARRTVLMGAGAGLLLAVLVCLLAPAKWEARMTIGPAGRGTGPDLSAFLPASESPTIQYLLQRVGSMAAADFAVYETLLTSPRIASSLLKDQTLKPRLGNLCGGCDADTSKLSGWLEGHVRIRPVAATQMRRITLALHDKTLATDLLRALHRLADETIRADVRLKTDQRIVYLREKMAEVVNPAQRDALVALLKEQERQSMMVGIDNDFAAEMIDPPSIPVRPVFPNPVLLLPLFILLGAAGGFGYALLRRS
ncbi:MAG: hypothetical protein KGQ41_05670 [Alphaproteobacteria bacterium]|nr:hypothetical protein [Alphaproteobacteria bacterium]